MGDNVNKAVVVSREGGPDIKITIEHENVFIRDFLVAKNSTEDLVKNANLLAQEIKDNDKRKELNYTVPKKRSRLS